MATYTAEAIDISGQRLSKIDFTCRQIQTAKDHAVKQFGSLNGVFKIVLTFGSRGTTHRWLKDNPVWRHGVAAGKAEYKVRAAA